MKHISAVIQAHMLSSVVSVLHRLNKFPGFIDYDIRGQGVGRGVRGCFRVIEDCFDSNRMAVLGTACAHTHLANTTYSVQQSAPAGHIGDGHIVVTEFLNLDSLREITRESPLRGIQC